MSVIILNKVISFVWNIVTQTLILWIWPVFKNGTRSDFGQEHLIRPKASFDSQVLGDEFESLWKHEVDKSREGERTPSLWRMVGRAYWISYMPGGILVLGNSITRSIQPILFSRLLTFWSDECNMSRLNAGYYAISIVGVGLLGSLFQHHGTLFNGRFGMKIRIGCTSLLYRKLLRLNKSSLHSETSSKLVNLMTNDVSRLNFSFMFLHYIWLTPIQAGVVIYLLYQSAGFAPIVGLAAVFFIIIPIQGVIGKRMGNIRQETAKKTDTRIKYISEVLNAIKLIKMSAWESLFRKSVEKSRTEEVKCIKKSVFIQGFFGSFMLFTEKLSVYVTVLYLVFTGNNVITAKIFPIQLYFSLIQTNMALYLPLATVNLSEMTVSFRRIQEFLLLEENVTIENRYEISKKSGTIAKTHFVKDLNESRRNDCNNSPVCLDGESKDSIIIKNAIANWQNNQHSNVINGLSLRVQQGTLCTIIGPVGAGKTSLIHMILKEIPLVSGEMYIQGKISYASQDPWLFPATIRDNIIFGSTFNQEKYEKVCEVCCLIPDLQQFPCGDMSLVGDRGVSLSGGQRARINLARAVYREADIYLLDDPLSAVDANVGRALFDGCINGYLAGRTRVLVTHQTNLLKAEEHVLLIKHGQLTDARSLIGLSHNKDFISNIVPNEQEPLGRPNKLRSKSSELRVFDGTQMKQISYEEVRASGGFKWKMLQKYISAVNSKFIVTVTLITLIMGNVVALTVDYWISYWSNQTMDNNNIPKNATGLADTNTSIPFNLGVYSGLILYLMLISFIRINWFVAIIGLISVNLHDVMFKKVIHATFPFFGNKTTGQILNRFSKDIGTIDELLPRSILQVAQLYLSILSVFILNAISLPWSLILSAILVFLYFIMLKWYLVAAQTVKRLEGTTMNPVLSMVDSSASGITTIRSLQSESMLIKSFDTFQDSHTSAGNSFLGISGAFGMYLDMISLIYLCVLLAIFITVDFGTMIPVGKVGLAVSQSLALTMMFQYSARFTAELTGHMVAVERAFEFTVIPVEENRNKLYTVLPATWPAQGNILYKNISLSYGKHRALKNVNFEIKGGWKVGVVGRTGSGKSSLAVALFNLIRFEGILKIDKVDIKLIHNQNLRKRITIIPQEPILFSATLRYNLDPFNSFSDEDIWRALEQVELKGSVDNLDQLLVEGGSIFSVGQRQLICLARAILQSNKILVMDEATANVDLQTDALIQKTIRREFASCTVLTIAHRLNTIMDSDRVIVMDKGEIVEFDHPYTLLCDPKSKFSSMVEDTGEKEMLFNVAKKSYNK